MAGRAKQTSYMMDRSRVMIYLSKKFTNNGPRRLMAQAAFRKGIAPMSPFKPIQTFVTGMTAAAALLTASMSFAADENVLPTTGDSVETYLSSKYWTVFKNNTRRSCFIEWRSENSVVQAGLTVFQDSGYLGAFLKDFEPPEGDHVIDISLNDNLYVGNSTTVSRTLSGGLKGGYIVFDNPNFVSDLEEAREFVAFQGSPYKLTVKLKTPRNAIDRARDCMASF